MRNAEERKMSAQFTISIIKEKEYPVNDRNVFKDVIGQAEAKATLDFFVKTHNIDTPFPTMLFTGSHGLGKTFFAKKVAKVLGRQFLEVNCGDIKDSYDFIEIVLAKVFNRNQPTTILMDEAHALSNDITTILLTFLNPTEKGVNEFVYKGINIEWNLHLINVIFATTDGYKIFKPLRNRCQEVYFYPYSEEELYGIVTQYLPGVKLACSKRDLALTCRGRARDAYVLSTNIKRYIVSLNKGVFSQDDLNILKGALGILPMGLKKNEVDVLKVIEKHGPISASNLAIRMMVNTSNIEEELEIRLRELGLIESSSRGRRITEDGLGYLSRYLV
jgi:holliday junction DNA helicase RuvB